MSTIQNLSTIRSIVSNQIENNNKRRNGVTSVSTSKYDNLSSQVMAKSIIEHQRKKAMKVTEEKNSIYVTSQGEENNYMASPVGDLPIYPTAPVELLQPDISTSVDIDKKALLVYYFETLYPLTRSSGKWRHMSVEKLQDYYDSLQFWYIFNTSWTASPMPVTLSDKVYKNWEKCTFFQAGTVVQSAITSWGLGWRGNNGPQNNVQSSLTYIDKNGNQNTITSVTTDKEYWDIACGDKMEVTSWGWNPYPFGIYAQGPFHGTGNFLQIPEQGIGGTIVGTSHWDIILKCKADTASNRDVWTCILNHEIHDTNINRGEVPPKVYSKEGREVTPFLIIYDQRNDTWKWQFMSEQYQSGYTPLLIAYFLWYVGGFGGIGGNKVWGSKWYNKNYRCTPVYFINNDGNIVFPTDQSIPISAGLPGGFTRSSDEFWGYFENFFALIQAWDTDWNVQKWRHPVLYTQYKYNNNDYYAPTVGPSVSNPSDSLMMAFVTGNFQIVKWSAWLSSGNTTLSNELGAIDPSLSKFSDDPALWSHYQDSNGTILDTKTGTEDGFPIGVMTHKGSGYNFVIRTQMPNVNYDICSEFADFRVTTPGQLATGVGDQNMWVKMFTIYAENYMFTADPDNTDIHHSFTDDFAIKLPDTKLRTSDPKIQDWKIGYNSAIGKTFFNFDVLSGMWVTDPYITGINSDNKVVLMNQSVGKAPSEQATVYVYGQDTNNCINTLESSLVPPAANKTAIQSISGGAITNSKYSSGTACQSIPHTNWGQSITNAPANTKYWPSPGDSFAKGVVGFQADGTNAQLGSSQTRWIMSSKGIGWDYSAPLSNRLLLLRGARNLYNTGNINTLLVVGATLLVIVTIAAIILYFKRIALLNNLTKVQRYAIFSALIVSGIIGIVLLITAMVKKKDLRNYLSSEIVNDESHRLRTYLALVYPMVPVSRWKSMSLEELRIFFCSLHWWYKGEGLPSPIDYLNTKYWNDTVPFGKGSSWKKFCLRKNCVVNVSPPAYNETDGKICIGYDKDIVSTTQNESPSAIIWNGRQLQSLGAQTQQTTFFHPSNNYHIDTYNNFPTVNDTGLEEWQKVKYVEVSSQWGPFPDGIYYDWAPGTGVWLSLEKHAVGYNGLDLVRRMGTEAIQKNINLTPIYQEAWQKTGLSSMVLANDNSISIPNIYWPDYYAGFGWYGTVIMTTSQNEQINNVAVRVKGNWMNSDKTQCADGSLFSKIAKFVTPHYLVEGDKGEWSWSNSKPNEDDYVENYPLPLPYFTTFKSNGNGLPQVNPRALRMPWKYQLFNICRMMRGFCIDLLFLDDGAVDTSTYKGLEYVDWLKANQKKPLRSARSWETAIDTCNKLLSSPQVHPLFLIYPRLAGRGDGPKLILSVEDEQDLTLEGIQFGALDTDKFIQTVDKNNGATYTGQNSIPQASSANLEIDHWLPMLGRPMGYKSCVRIQHWCGNKSLSLDIEIINISQQISGNLISNMPTDSMYEVWKKGGKERLSVRDPFADDSHVYSNDGPIHDIRQKYLPKSPRYEATEWTAPPWVQYFPDANMYNGESNVYGWPAENLSNFMATNRLSYCPANAQQVTLSGSYPEYNKTIFENMVKNKTLLNL